MAAVAEAAVVSASDSVSVTLLARFLWCHFRLDPDPVRLAAFFSALTCAADGDDARVREDSRACRLSPGGALARLEAFNGRGQTTVCAAAAAAAAAAILTPSGVSVAIFLCASASLSGLVDDVVPDETAEKDPLEASVASATFIR